MRKLRLNNPSFEYLEKGFAEWLDILGYCEGSTYTMPNIIREFLHHLEALKVGNIKEIKQSHIKSYYNHINSRGNQKKGGGLSNNYLNKHLQALEKFLGYLHHKGVEPLPTLGIRQEKINRKEIHALTVEEIRQLFEATNNEDRGLSKKGKPELQQIINARDRAMLVIYYSCGLRRNEGLHVHIDDINFDAQVLHVRKGKNYKERFVPFNKTNAQYLQEYIYDHRPNLLRRKKESTLFISLSGNPMTGGTINNRLQLLVTETENISLQEKKPSLHTLRHSIATHLLQAGMSLEKIARFLGHSSLESTQIYTHLAEQQAQLV